MRRILLGGMALAAVAIMGGQQARAQAVVVETHPYYWQEHHESEWRRRAEFREAEHRRAEWLREHCIRDWAGHELCRR